MFDLQKNNVSIWRKQALGGQTPFWGNILAREEGDGGALDEEDSL